MMGLPVRRAKQKAAVVMEEVVGAKDDSDFEDSPVRDGRKRKYKVSAAKRRKRKETEAKAVAKAAAKAVAKAAAKDAAKAAVKAAKLVKARQKQMERAVPVSRKVRKARQLVRHEKLNQAKNEVVNNGMSAYEAAKRFQLPYSTLKEWVAKARNHQDGGSAERICYKFTLFSREQEEVLLQYCQKMARIGYLYTSWQVIDLAQNMALSMLDWSSPRTKLPGRHWYYEYLQRHPEFKVKNQKKKKLKDNQVSEETTINLYYDELQKTMEDIGVDGHLMKIWNLDETGVVLDYPTPKVLFKASEKCEMVSNGKSPTTTLIAAISAYGETLPPYIVQKGQRITDDMIEGIPDGTAFKCCEAGWSNSEIFQDFLFNHFAQHVHKRPILLLYDGHTSHYTANVIIKAKEIGIHLFVLPPHMSHFLQPLGNTCFGPFKQKLSTIINSWLIDNPGELVTESMLPRMICDALTRSMTVANIQSFFRHTGICPLNRLRIPVLQETRKETQNKRPSASTKTISQHLDSIHTHYVTQISRRKRKENSLIPTQGACITGRDFLQKNIDQETSTAVTNILYT